MRQNLSGGIRAILVDRSPYVLDKLVELLPIYGSCPEGQVKVGMIFKDALSKGKL